MRTKMFASHLLTVFVIVLTAKPPFFSEISSASPEYAYYGYVPIGTDAGAPNLFPQRRNIDELINGVVYNFTPPEGTALLDVIGIHDDTNVEIWDVLAHQMLGSRVVNKLEKWTYFIKFGTFFKVVADKRVSVYQNGGCWSYLGYDSGVGDMTFYPSDEGGFVGKSFTFIPPNYPDAYITYHYGSNLLCTALEDAHVTVYDSTGGEVMSFDLAQGTSLPYNRGRLAARINHGAPTVGGGNSIIFRVESTGRLLIRTLNKRSFLAVPAVTGGFVGKLFVTPATLAVDEYGAEEVLIIVPIETGKVSVYDNKMNLLAEKEFSQADIDGKQYWYHSLGKSSQTLIIKSTCKITVLEGATYIPPELEKTTIGIEDLGSNIAYIGARANEETRFYVPTTAVLFAPEDLTAEIDGETKTLKRDEFVLLDRGVHSVTPDHEVIIQLNCAGNIMRVEIWDYEPPYGTGELLEVRQAYWTDWGSYLISVEDVKKTFEVPSGFGEVPAGGMDLTMIIAAVALVVAVVGGGFFILKKRRSSLSQHA
ncbi:MAG: hypothetical protein ACE5NN_02415 [Candidatus Bathyarchaeia archaeon]